MANKKVVAGQKTDQTSRLLTRIGITQGKSLLEKLWPSNRIIRRGSDVLRMECPVHDDATPSFDMNFQTGSMFCFGCKYSTTSVFKLLQQTKGMSYAQTIELVRGYVDIRGIADSALKDLSAQDHYDNAIRLLAEVFNTNLRNLLAGLSDEVYTAAVHDGASVTLDWLFRERQRDRDLVPYMPYGVTPTPLVFDKLLVTAMDAEVERKMRTLKTYPDKEWRVAVLEQAKDLYKSIDPGYYHSVAYFTGFDYATFGRIKLRRPSDDKRNNITVLKGRGETDAYGYFGLASMYPRFQGKLDAESLVVVVTEGENDALSLMEYAYRESKAGYLILGSGGSANELDELAECGIKTVNLLSDVENRGGLDYILQKLSTAREVDVRVFSAWNDIMREEPSVKDPDELVRQVGPELAFQWLVQRTERYIPLTDWITTKILDELSELPADDRSVRAQLGVIRKYGPCVRHPASVTELVRKLQATGIPEGDLRRELLTVRDSSEAAFKLAIVSTLREEFHPVFFVPSVKSPSVKVFHKARKAVVDLSLTDPEAAVMSMARMHGSVYEFMRDRVGIPPFLGAGEEGPNTTPERSLTPQLNTYLKFAMQEFVKGLPIRSECTEFGQGMHYTTDPTTGDVVQYVNNGSLVMKGRYVSPGSTLMEWEALPGPSEGNAFFRTNKTSWSKEIKHVDDMIEGNNVSKDEILKEIKTLVDIVSKGWVFSHQAVMPTFVAWDCVAKALGYVTPRKTIIHATGDSHAGKSTLMALYSGNEAPYLQVVEASKIIDNFTMASLYQSLHRSTLLACMDEFEDKRDNLKHSNEIQSAIKLMRGIVGEGGTPVNRGSIDGEIIEYSVHTNFLLASILRAHDVQDDNRRFEIDLRYVAGRGDTKQLLLQTYSPDDFRRIRRTLSVALPKLAREYLEHYRRIDLELSSKTLPVPFQVPQRFIHSTLPVLAMMGMFGEDYLSYLVKLCHAKQTKLTSSNNDTQAAVLFERMMRGACIRAPGEEVAALRITDFLGTPGDMAGLNRTRCGAMMIPGTSLLVIEHVTAQGRGGIYENWPEYRTQSHRNMKHALDQHPYAIRTEDYDKFKVSNFVRGAGGSYNSSMISVLNIDPLIRELRENRQLSAESLDATRALNDVKANATESTGGGSTEGDGNNFY